MMKDQGQAGVYVLEQGALRPVKTLSGTDYRVTVGKGHLDLSHCEEWAAGLDHTVRKVNFEEVPVADIAAWYDTTETAVRSAHADLVKVLDIMPCDYRYFRGDDNPLDKLVEAALMLEDLERRFQEA